jgi:hypothetical protein
MLASTMTLTLQASMLHLYIRHYIWHNKQFTSHNLQSLKHNKQYDVDKKKTMCGVVVTKKYVALRNNETY